MLAPVKRNTGHATAKDAGHRFFEWNRATQNQCLESTSGHDLHVDVIKVWFYCMKCNIIVCVLRLEFNLILLNHKSPLSFSPKIRIVFCRSLEVSKLGIPLLC